MENKTNNITLMEKWYKVILIWELNRISFNLIAIIGMFLGIALAEKSSNAKYDLIEPMTFSIVAFLLLWFYNLNFTISWILNLYFLNTNPEISKTYRRWTILINYIVAFFISLIACYLLL